MDSRASRSRYPTGRAAQLMRLTDQASNTHVLPAFLTPPPVSYDVGRLVPDDEVEGHFEEEAVRAQVA